VESAIMWDDPARHSRGGSLSLVAMGDRTTK
jgi:hypothetical protein